MSSSEGQPGFDVHVEGPAPVPTQLAELGDGNVAIHLDCTVAGEYQLAVRQAASDLLVGGSAIAVRVEPDSAAVASCQAPPVISLRSCLASYTAVMSKRERGGAARRSANIAGKGQSCPVHTPMGYFPWIPRKIAITAWLTTFSM